MSSSLAIRFATPTDVPDLFALVVALAEYERLAHEVTGTPELLHEHLFGDRPYVEALVAEWDGAVVGFALFFSNYSTFLTRPGLYLEDLFVRPDFRGRGIGKATIATVARIARDRGCGRFEWSVLDWNEPAIAFYKQMGATIMEDWRTCRVTGAAIAELAERAPT